MTTKTAPDGTRVQLSSDEVRQVADVSRWFDNEIKIPSQAQTLLEHMPAWCRMRSFRMSRSW